MEPSDGIDWGAFEQFGDSVDVDALLAESFRDERAALLSFERLRNAAEYQGSVASVAEPLVAGVAALAGEAQRQSVRLEAATFIRDLTRATSFAEASGRDFDVKSADVHAATASRVRVAAEAAASLLRDSEDPNELTVLDYCWVEVVRLGAQSIVSLGESAGAPLGQGHVVVSSDQGWVVSYLDGGKSVAGVREPTVELACARLMRRVRSDPNGERSVDLEPIHAAMFGLWAGWMSFEESTADLEAVARWTGPQFDTELASVLNEWTMLASADPSIAPDTKAFALSARYFLLTSNGGQPFDMAGSGSQRRNEIEQSLRARFENRSG